MKSLIIAGLMFFAVMPAKSQQSGCQYTGGAFQLQKIRASAAGSQIIGCINSSFEALSSSIPVAGSSSAYSPLGWIAVNRISGMSIGAAGIRISSATTFTSSVTIAAGGGLGLTYGMSASTIVATYAQLSSATFTGGINVTAGNLGIGTTIPRSKLGVLGSVTSHPPSFGTVAAPVSHEGFVSRYDNSALYLAGLFFHNTLTDNGANWMSVQTSPNGGTPVEVFRIDKDGNVGVGTTNPKTKMHVSSGAFLLDGNGTGIKLNASGGVGTSGQSYIDLSLAGYGPTSGTTQWVGNVGNILAHWASATHRFYVNAGGTGMMDINATNISIIGSTATFTSTGDATLAAGINSTVSIGTMTIKGSGHGLPQSQALCVTTSQILGYCTTVVGVTGGCTCAAP